MSERRPGGRSQWSRNGSKLAVGIAVAIGVGSSCYYLYKSLQSSTISPPATKKNTENPPKNKSRCVIATKSVVDSLDTVPWVKLLEEEKELVIIVVPGCKDTFKLDLDPRIAYKLIHCDTTLGVWSCVKSLRKYELFVNIGEFPEGEQTIPEDIPRYTPSVFQWKNKEDILTSFAI